MNCIHHLANRIFILTTKKFNNIIYNCKNPKTQKHYITKEEDFATTKSTTQIYISTHSQGTKLKSYSNSLLFLFFSSKQQIKCKTEFILFLFFYQRRVSKKALLTRSGADRVVGARWMTVHTGNRVRRSSVAAWDHILTFIITHTTILR